jgi:hypothetical protein
MIEFRGRRLWAHTEGLQVLLALMVEAAEKLDANDERWFQELVAQWRVEASVAVFGRALDDSWSPEQLTLIKDVIGSVRRELREPDAVHRVLRPGWSVLDDLPVADGVSPLRVIERVDEVADAMIQLLDQRLPPNPPGSWWFVGLGEGVWQHVKVRGAPGPN